MKKCYRILKNSSSNDPRILRGLCVIVWLEKMIRKVPCVYKVLVHISPTTMEESVQDTKPTPCFNCRWKKKIKKSTMFRRKDLHRSRWWKRYKGQEERKTSCFVKVVSHCVQSYMFLTVETQGKFLQMYKYVNMPHQ